MRPELGILLRARRTRERPAGGQGSPWAVGPGHRSHNRRRVGQHRREPGAGVSGPRACRHWRPSRIQRPGRHRLSSSLLVPGREQARGFGSARTLASSPAEGILRGWPWCGCVRPTARCCDSRDAISSGDCLCIKGRQVECYCTPLHCNLARLSGQLCSSRPINAHPTSLLTPEIPSSPHSSLFALDMLLPLKAIAFLASLPSVLIVLLSTVCLMLPRDILSNLDNKKPVPAPNDARVCCCKLMPSTNAMLPPTNAVLSSQTPNICMLDA